MNPTPPPRPADAGEIPELWLEDLRAGGTPEPSWLWHGYLAPGNATLLTSLWKAGKTTLVSVLLAKLGAGGELAGRPLAAGRAVVVSEENPSLWLARSRKLDFGRHVCWICRPFRGRPQPADWLGLLDRLERLHDRHRFALVVVDPLAAFLPGHAENNSGTMLGLLLPLQRLMARGLAVLLLHHPRKKAAAAGMRARGSGALPAFADILIEMDWYAGRTGGDRRRTLTAFARYDETPPRWVIELSADGTDYVSHGDYQADAFEPNWHRLRAVLETAPSRLTREQVLAAWPPGEPPPHPVTLWRWLERARAEGLVQRNGTGHHTAPFRYWLTGQEDVWRNDPTRLPELPPLAPLEGYDGEPMAPSPLVRLVLRRLRGKGR